MADYDVRELTADALEDACILSTTAGWNQRHRDWQMLLALAPHGCYAAWQGGRVVGTAIGIDYRGFGWIAMMLVDPAHRSRGLGRTLLEAAVHAIPPGRPVRLDATPLGRPLYESYGFVHEMALTRFVAPGSSGAAPAQTARGSRPAVRPLAAADLSRVAAVDGGLFGGDRRAVLEWALAEAPALAWIAEDGGSGPQYCFGRTGRLFTQIGPVVASDDDTARALVEAALGGIPDQPVTIDAFDGCRAFTGWLTDRGFQVQRPLFRMGRPPADGTAPARRQAASPLAERAIFGPEFA
jgi:GNAT superfamily N-acetyltransferase